MLRSILHLIGLFAVADAMSAQVNEAKAAVLFVQSGTVGDPSNSYNPGYTAGQDTLHYDPDTNKFYSQFWDASYNAQAQIPSTLFQIPIYSFYSAPITYRIVLTFGNRPISATQVNNLVDNIGAFYVTVDGATVVQAGYGVGSQYDFINLVNPQQPATIYGNSVVLIAKQYLDFDGSGQFVFPGPSAIQAQLSPSDFGETYELEVSTVPDAAGHAAARYGVAARILSASD